MKIALYSRQVNVRDVAFIQKFFKILHDRKLEVSIHQSYLESLKEYIEVPASFHSFSGHHEIKDNTDFVFSLGGDGTLLDTVQFVRDYNIPVMGINIGRLGFLANIGKDEVNVAIDALYSGSYITDQRTMLSLEANPHLFGEVNYALNDFTVVKKDASVMLTIHAYLNGEFLNSYWADGLIVSTATGSTGYSLSCGGPIIVPSSSDLVVTPIAPHNLNVRPVVVPDNTIVSLEIEGRSANYMCTLDSRSETIDPSYQLAIKKCEHKFNLVRLPDHNFLHTLSSKLNWGIDARK